MNRMMAPVMGILLLSPLDAFSFEFVLSGGLYYGPGKTVTHFPLGALNAFNSEGFLRGRIPYFNNGAVPPNIFAETVHTNGLVDGALSDGTLLSEHIDNGFIITTSDPENGVVDTLIAAIEGGPYNGQELVEPDAKGNLTIHVYAGFDNGNPLEVAKTDVHPTTGAVRIPLSLKTQQGLPGGHDFAGPFPSGRVFIGRLGDFDQDGFMDGDLLLSQPSPVALKVGQGDPVYFNRPFFSDLPITAIGASVLTINGIVQNFGPPIHETLAARQLDVTFGYLSDVSFRIDTANANLRRALANRSLASSARQKVRLAQSLLLQARSQFNGAMKDLDSGSRHGVGDDVDDALRVLANAQAMLQRLEPQSNLENILR